jgi:tRNA(adenine34) deaminase
MKTEKGREEYMGEALSLAREALEAEEVPVGCVVVNAGGEIVGRGRNRHREMADASAHAEILAIREACRQRGSWRLQDCTLYVTLEPCPMCAGAVINAMIPEVVYGASEPRFGSCGSVINLFEENYGHRPRIYAGVREEESRRLLQEFFKRLRGE